MTDINDKVAGEPTTPAPKADPKGEPKGEPKDEASALLAELKNLGIDNPDKLHGVVNASQQAGKAWNEVGELRRIKQDLEAKLDRVLSVQQKNQDPYTDSDSIDLGALIENKLETFWDKKTRQQQEAEARYYQEMNRIQNNPRFQSVEGMFQKHIQTPAVQAKLRNGETTLTDEFYNVKDAFYDELLKRSYNTLSQSKSPQSAKAPHVESGETHTPNIPATDDERQEKLKRTVKSRADGTKSSNDALQDIVNSFLPQDDPIWRT